MTVRSVLLNPHELIDFDFFNDFADTKHYLEVEVKHGNKAQAKKRLEQLEMLNERYEKSRAWDFAQKVKEKKNKKTLD